MLMHGKSQKETIHEELKRLSWSYMYVIIQQAYWQACILSMLETVRCGKNEQLHI